MNTKSQSGRPKTPLILTDDERQGLLGRAALEEQSPRAARPNNQHFYRTPAVRTGMTA